ncbi:AAA-ATPase At3g50940-like [Vicia villosa]|uniref:AAA-ATPase At3g50940-like n=1 Tax=Vicia villosa TaxID=3911 RepID=UPI00273CC503|nr:AAA-ATPase At3g50940-like [Vicia villosa]
MRSPMFGGFSSSFTNIGSASSWFEIYAAFSTFMMLLRTAINDLIPIKLRNFIISKLSSFFTNYQPNNQASLQIDRFWDGITNHLYCAAKEYLPTKISNTYKSLKVGKLSKHHNVLFAFDGKQVVTDEFEDIKVKWKLVGKSKDDDELLKNPRRRHNKSNDYDENGFVLSFDEKYREKVMKKYIPHILTTYETLKAENRTLKIHSMQSGSWIQSDLTHPASFESIALDPDLKKSIIDDIDRFLRRKKLYHKVGKPWKRGYLLYGPPGTGKSSLIAAIAKYLKFDVYDLDLSSVFSNSDLMRVMRETSNRSIVVFEDIDCNSEVLDRSKSDQFSDNDFLDTLAGAKMVKTKFTLSGLLNYVDGLWSGCGEERILIFTTNHKDKVDSALLRPGRMDMHIHLSFLKGKAFRILASNYLDIEEQHGPLIEQIEELLGKVDVTPAVAAEYLLRSEDPNVALEGLVKFLQEIDVSKVVVNEENNQKV